MPSMLFELAVSNSPPVVSVGLSIVRPCGIGPPPVARELLVVSSPGSSEPFSESHGERLSSSFCSSFSSLWGAVSGPESLRGGTEDNEPTLRVERLPNTKPELVDVVVVVVRLEELVVVEDSTLPKVKLNGDGGGGLNGRGRGPLVGVVKLMLPLREGKPEKIFSEVVAGVAVCCDGTVLEGKGFWGFFIPRSTSLKSEVGLMVIAGFPERDSEKVGAQLKGEVVWEVAAGIPAVSATEGVALEAVVLTARGDWIFVRSERGLLRFSSPVTPGRLPSSWRAGVPVT